MTKMITILTCLIISLAVIFIVSCGTGPGTSTEVYSGQVITVEHQGWRYVLYVQNNHGSTVLLRSEKIK